MSVEDYKEVFSDTFDPVGYANGLVVSTNESFSENPLSHNIFSDSSEKELDLETAAKKVAFALKDVDNRISKAAAANYETLIDEFEVMERFQKSLTIGLLNSLNELQLLTQPLDKDFVQNYDTLQKLTTRQENIQTTLSLVNELLFFLDSLKKFNTAFKEVPMEETFSRKEKITKENLEVLTDSLKKASGLFYLLNKIINDNNDKDGLFKQTKVIRTFNKEYKGGKIDKINNFCLDLLKNDSFVEQAEEALKTVVCTMVIFNTTDLLIELFNRLYKQEQAACVSILKNSMVSPENFDSTMAQVSRKSRKMLVLMRVLSGLHLLTYNHDVLEAYPFAFLEKNTGSQPDLLSLGEFILKNMSVSMNNNTLFTNFFKDLSIEFEKMVSRTMVKGGPVAKNLKANKARIGDSIKKRIIENNSDFYHVGEKNLEVVMMTNAIRKLA